MNESRIQKHAVEHGQDDPVVGVGYRLDMDEPDGVIHDQADALERALVALVLRRTGAPSQPSALANAPRCQIRNRRPLARHAQSRTASPTSPNSAFRPSQAPEQIGFTLGFSGTNGQVSSECGSIQIRSRSLSTELSSPKNRLLQQWCRCETGVYWFSCVGVRTSIL